MRWAIAQGHRADNPAGHAITAALPRNGRQSRHFKAPPHGKVAKALATVRGSTAGDGVRPSFEFIVLTAARSGEVRGTLWEEIDEEAGVWRVPGFRTKTGRSHRVPLSSRTLEVLEEARETLGGDPIFRAVRSRRRPLATGAWRALLRRLSIEATVHGFRSSFRDWCGKPGCRTRWRRRVSLTRSAIRLRRRTPGPTSWTVAARSWRPGPSTACQLRPRPE